MNSCLQFDISSHKNKNKIYAKSITIKTENQIGLGIEWYLSSFFFMSTVTNEDEYNNLKTGYLHEKKASFRSDLFSELERVVKGALAKQDSDNALIFITK